MAAAFFIVLVWSAILIKLGLRQRRNRLYVTMFTGVVLAGGGAVGCGDDWTRNGDRCKGLAAVRA